MKLTDFLGKIEWEGGVAGALDYGLKKADLEAADRETWPSLAEVWDAACDAYAAFAGPASEVEALSEEIRIRLDEEGERI